MTHPGIAGYPGAADRCPGRDRDPGPAGRGRRDRGALSGPRRGHPHRDSYRLITTLAGWRRYPAGELIHTLITGQAAEQ
jgi:hypothetical protein